jgi:molybdopterin biosynthesis enzyme
MERLISLSNIEHRQGAFCLSIKGLTLQLQFLRVEVTETGILRTMIRANGIALLSAARDVFAAGEEVEVILLGPPVAA